MFPTHSTAVNVAQVARTGECSAKAACFAFGIAFAGVTWTILLIGTALL